MNRLDPQRRAYILHSLCEGMSQRSCERIFGVSNKTVAKLFEEAGDMAISHVASLRDLTPKRIQADELHAFVAAKQRNVEYMAKSKEDAGSYLMICDCGRLLLNWLWNGLLYLVSTRDCLRHGRSGFSVVEADLHGRRDKRQPKCACQGVVSELAHQIAPYSSEGAIIVKG